MKMCKLQSNVILTYACMIVRAATYMLIVFVATLYREPYVLYTTQFGIHKMLLNDSSIVEDLVVGGFGYACLDYHYE